MKQAICLACALAPALALWPLARTDAAPRCYPTNRFVVLAGGLVSDRLTNLVWQQQASTATMSWSEAMSYCTAAGFRLPTVKELRSIVDYSVPPPGPTINPKAFPNTPAEEFWTSTENRGFPDYSWFVSFKDGLVNSNGTINALRARCVR